jgi:hypothetical protein
MPSIFKTIRNPYASHKRGKLNPKWVVNDRLTVEQLLVVERMLQQDRHDEAFDTYVNYLQKNRKMLQLYRRLKLK